MCPLLKCSTLHRGAFCQFLFRWIYYIVVNPPERKLTKPTSVHWRVRHAWEADCSFFDTETLSSRNLARVIKSLAASWLRGGAQAPSSTVAGVTREAPSRARAARTACSWVRIQNSNVCALKAGWLAAALLRSIESTRDEFLGTSHPTPLHSTKWIRIFYW